MQNFLIFVGLLATIAYAQKDSGPKCTKPKSAGVVCKGPFLGALAQPEPRWYYNDKFHMCVSFIYNGCEGNNNNFLSKEDCEWACQPADGMDCAAGSVPNGKCSTLEKCPTGYTCVSGAFNRVCCEEETEKRFRDEIKPKCKTGKVYALGSRSKHPLLADSCDDLACPRGYKCIAGQLFAHCCPDDNPFMSATTRVQTGKTDQPRTSPTVQPSVSSPGQGFIRTGQVVKIWPPPSVTNGIPKPTLAPSPIFPPGFPEDQKVTETIEKIPFGRERVTLPATPQTPARTAFGRFGQSTSGNSGSSVIFAGSGTSSGNRGTGLSRPGIKSPQVGDSVFGPPLVVGSTGNGNRLGNAGGRVTGFGPLARINVDRCRSRVPPLIQPSGIAPKSRWYHDALRNQCRMFFPSTIAHLNDYFDSLNQCLITCSQTTFN